VKLPNSRRLEPPKFEVPQQLDLVVPPGRFGFPTEQTVLFGFSQGSLMVWKARVRYPYRFAGCIGVSGFMREAALSLSIQHLQQLEGAEELSKAY
jgi:pimeloyl-ACP methyl ester carboxylesterase